MTEQNSPSHEWKDDALSSPPPVVIGLLEVEEDAAEETPRPLPQPYRRRRLRPQDEDGSRELMLGWCLWLLASWILLGMGFNGTPIRQMIFASCLGMMIAWPAYRLSQSGRKGRGEGEEKSQISNLKFQISEVPFQLSNPTASTAAHAAKSEIRHPQSQIRNPKSDIRNPKSLLSPGLIFRDWFALNGVFQAVIWPHLMTKHWTLEQAAWVSASVATWSLLIGAVVAWGCRSMTAAGRFAAMALVLAILFAEPVVLMVARDALPHEPGNVAAFNWAMQVSPIEAIHELTAPPVQFAATGWALPVVCVLLAAILGWVGVVRKYRETSGTSE